MKEILLVVRWPVGGIRTYVKYVFSGEQFSDAKITVIAPDVNNLSSQFGTVFPGDRFRYVPCENSSIGILCAVWRELTSRKFDVINVQGYNSAVASFVPASILARHTPKVLTVHDVLHQVQFLGLGGRFKRFLMAMIMKRYQCIIPVSEDCRGNMLEFFPEVVTTRIQTILNGVSVERLDNSLPLPLRESFADGKERLLVGFLGRFMSQKGFRYLVDAVDALVKDSSQPRKPYVFCYGFGGFYREEMADINSRGLTDYFKLSAQIEDVGAAMKALDVVVMPSLWEACPLLPMEVLICGTPLIASNCIGLREVVADTPAWVVPKGDAVALATALREVAANDRRAEFVAYMPTAKARFDVARTRAQLATLYGELLADIRP